MDDEGWYLPGEEKTYKLSGLNEGAMYDGLCVVCTNLEYAVPDIISVNTKRWKIEECFRIMKTEFKARPVYLSRKDRITAYFTTCFTALLIYRTLKKKLHDAFGFRTDYQIISQKNMRKILNQTKKE